MNRAFKVI